MVVTRTLPEDKSVPVGGWRDKLDYARQMLQEAGVEYKVLE